MDGTRHSATSADGVRIGLLTAGSGPGLLLVHGGMGTIESWQHVWRALARQRWPGTRPGTRPGPRGPGPLVLSFPDFRPGPGRWSRLCCGRVQWRGLAEFEMVKTWEVARTTARRAIALLREEGLVHTVPQRGTYVL